MQTFDAKDPGEILTLTFDFTDDLGPGEFLNGTQIITVTTASGLDATPTAILNGAPQLSGSNLVLQSVSGGVPNAGYFVTVTSGTNIGRVLAIGGLLPVIPAAIQNG